MAPRHLGLFLLLAMVSGTTFLFIRLGVATIPPLTFALLRLSLAAALLCGVLRLRREPLPRGSDVWLGLATLGLINAALPYALFAWGTGRLGANASGLAAIYNATGPLWTLLFALLFAPEERLAPGRALGVGLGFAGVVWIFASSLGGLGAAATAAQALCLAGAACAGAGPIYLRRKLGQLPALAAAFGQLAAGALWLLPAAVSLERHAWRQPSAASLAALLALALLGTGLGQALYFTLVKEIGATRTAQVSYLIPVFALVWGWLVLGEPLRAELLLGLGLILLGMALVNGRRRVGSQPAAEAAGGERQQQANASSSPG